MSGEEYKKWVDKAFQYIEKVYDRVDQLKNVNVGSTQYIPKIDGEIELVFLGHDAHEGRGENDKLDITFAKERFYKGNGDPRYWRKCPEWKIWNNMERALWRAGFTEIMEKGLISEEILNKTIVTNALLFTYGGYAKELNTRLKQDIVNDCMKLAGKLIFDVIKPRMVICSSCPLVFEPLIKNYNAEIRYEVFSLKGTSRRVMRCNHNDVTVLGIPHTSYPVTLTVAAFVRDSYLGKDIGYSMSNLATTPNGFVSYNTSFSVKHIIDLVTSNQDFNLTKIENTSERYCLSDNLLLTITKTGKGYLAIRHKTFNGKIQYPNSKYEFTERYRCILKENGWNCDTPVWLGTKFIKDFGHKDYEIVTKIVSEINNIVELVNKDY
ncbi:MAG: hypothetical protein IJ898_06590 [Prevotella sp.]|nr:hypothetical protein [Prevotella sp.]